MIAFTSSGRIDQSQRMPARIIGLVGRIIVSTAIIVRSAIIVAATIVAPGSIVVAIVFVVLSPLLCRYSASDHPKHHPCESGLCHISSPVVVPVTAGGAEIIGATRYNGSRHVSRNRSCHGRR